MTFPVCLVPVLFMLSVRSPMPPRPEPEVPRGWIKTSTLGQGEIPASASGATASGVSRLHVNHLYFLTPRKTRHRRDENMPGTVTGRTGGRAGLSPELIFKMCGIQNQARLRWRVKMMPFLSDRGIVTVSKEKAINMSSVSHLPLIKCQRICFSPFIFS